MGTHGHIIHRESNHSTLLLELSPEGMGSFSLRNHIAYAEIWNSQGDSAARPSSKGSFFIWGQEAMLEVAFLDSFLPPVLKHLNYICAPYC